MRGPVITHPDPELRWLLEISALPTAAGKESRIIDWLRAWTAERPDLSLAADAAGNLVIAPATPPLPPHPRPLYITAHLDHPAFVVERIIGPATVLVSFRGGVLDPYFKNARVRLFNSREDSIAGTITAHEKKEPFAECLVDLDASADTIELGDVGRWDLPDPFIDDDIVRTHACDDLSAVAAAVALMERLRGRPEAAHVRLLFTRAEEIGFIGAIAACKLRTMDSAGRVIALENSRSFAESPIGGGPIVRVGDRISIFSSALTGAVAKVAEKLASDRKGGFKWQRKLMAGGACEASAFQAYGYEATCICLPLGNYHNMADLERVQAGDQAAIAAARTGHEYISAGDYKGMIDLLEACATGLADAEPILIRMEKLYADKSFVLR
jgi:endoglucanase